jgi:hypothetical protein
MSAQSAQLFRSANYLFSVGKGDPAMGTPGYVGKLRSNFYGSEYNIFDHGENPASKPPIEKVRTQQGGILFVRVKALNNTGNFTFR